jgi:alkyl hydroperoxide reductase subunit AhpC
VATTDTKGLKILDISTDRAQNIQKWRRGFRYEGTLRKVEYVDGKAGRWRLKAE